MAVVLLVFLNTSLNEVILLKFKLLYRFNTQTIEPKKVKLKSTTLQKLGYPSDTTLLIIHADDAGLSHSENLATIECLEKGFVNSYSIMVPCPWFYEMGLYANSNPQFDYGVHLTLTCEWENYKFGPVLPISEVPTLVDKNGHFYKNREDLSKYGTPKDVQKELQAQIEKALKFGLKPTHIDSHMYSIGAKPEFFKIYKFLGEKFDLPVLINGQLVKMVGLDPITIINENDLVVDHLHIGEFKYFENGKLKNYYSETLKNLPYGLNVMLIHPAFDDNEMKGVTVDHPNFGSEWRQIDYDFFSKKENASILEENNVQLITWKEIKSRS